MILANLMTTSLAGGRLYGRDLFEEFKAAGQFRKAVLSFRLRQLSARYAFGILNESLGVISVESRSRFDGSCHFLPPP